MSKPQTKMMYLARAIRGVTASIYHFSKYYLATAILAVAFFLHYFLPHPEAEVHQALTEKNRIETELTELKDRIVLEADIPQPIKMDLYQLKADLQAANTIYQEADARNRIFGYPSRQKFLWSFGLGIIIAVLALRIMYLSHGIEEKNRKRSNQVMGLMGGIIAGHFFAWIFYPANDLPYMAYVAVLVGLGILASMMGYFLSKAFYVRRAELHRLRVKMDGMLDFLVEMKKVHYRRLLKIAMKKDIYDEVYQEEIKTSSKKFDERIYDKAEELVD